MANEMQIEEFRALAASFGANLLRWPEDKQVAAHRFAARTEAKVVLEEAAILDALLDRATLNEADAEFIKRLLAVPQQPNAPMALVAQSASQATAFRPAWMLSLVAFAVLGFGFAQYPTTTEIPAVNDAQSTAQDTTQSAVSLETIVLGPTTLNEVML